MSERRPILMLIDGPSLVYRGYFALPPLTTSDGTLVNAAFGFLQIVLRGMADLKPDHAILSFDLGKPQFRFEAHPAYKAGRPSMPDDLRSQFPIVREIAAMLGMPICEVEGFEADDVIATLARQASAQGVDTYIVSGDLDGLQLIDDRIRLLTTRMGVAATVIYDRARVMERYGLTPEQMLDYKALKGDVSDNIPGVPGVGEKTASSLLQRFRSLDELYARLDEVPGKLRDRLAEHRESAFMSRETARLIDDLPIRLDLEAARTGRYDRRAVAQRFRELEFRSLIDRLPPSTLAGSGQPDAEAETDGGGLQLSLDLAAPPEPGGGSPAPAAPPRAAIDAVADPRGALEGVAPRVAHGAEDVTELAAWLGRHEELGIGWLATGAGSAVTRPFIGIALAASDGTSWYVPWGEEVASPLRDWLARRDRPLIGHDLKSLHVMLAVRGVPVAGPAFDTLVASYMLNPALRAQALDDLAANRFEAELPPRPLNPETGAEEWPIGRRAASEALLSVLVRPALARELHEASLNRLFDEVEMPLVPVLARMELNGVAIDRDVLVAMSEEFGAELARLEGEIYAAVGREFNIGSPRQLEQVLFTDLRLPASKRTRTGYSTDASVLEELRSHHPAIGLILEHRQIAKLKSTYVDALPQLVNPATGRVHTTYNQAVATTGRLSSADPNLQNIPIRTPLGRRIRRAFVAGPGKLLLGADYSQQELRILAHVSGDEGLKADFAAHNDIHLAAAARVLGLRPEQVGPRERSVAKMINYGIAYGLSGFGLAQRLGIPQEEAERYIADYYTAYPGIRRYTVEMKILARDQGFVTTLLGRRRYIPELTARNSALRSAGERMAINMPIQGTAADGMKIAMVRLDAALRERGLRARMLLQVHDELVFETDEDELPTLAALAREVMEGALPLDPPLTVDLKVGEDWERMDRLAPDDEGGWRRVPRTEREVAEEAEELAALATGPASAVAV